MKFYEVDQNNSGGSFDVDNNVCHRLFIEADSEESAMHKAEELGCYWDGVEKGMDCDCCGDRWYGAHEINLEKINYGVSDYKSKDDWFKKYGRYTVIEEPKASKGLFGTRYDGRITFNSIEDYAQFLADDFGWTVPDIRIFYSNGIVKEIFSNR